MIHDLVVSCRSLRARPGWSLIAVATLGLGIGFTVAIFSIVDATLLQPLPYRQPEQLVRIWEMNPHTGRFDASEPNFLDLRRATRTLTHLAAHQPVKFDLTEGRQAERLAGARVSAEFFATLGVSPAIGRGFSAAEDQSDSEKVVILSDGLWRRRFGGDPEIVGRALDLDDVRHRVVGVLPSGFHFTDADAYVPLAADPASDRGNRWLGLVGRVRDDLPLSAVRSELVALTTRLGHDYPATNTGWQADLAPLSDALVPASFRRRAALLMAGACLLLLTGCVNVAHLLLARGRERRVEVAVRSALGASRARLLRQLLAESAILSAAAAVVGALSASWLIEIILWLEPAEIPRLVTSAIGGRALTFCLLLAVGTCLLCGFVPALRGSAAPLRNALVSGRMGSRADRRARSLLIAAELALATMLLVSASLVALSFWRLTQAETGLETHGVLAIPLRLPDERWSWGERATAVTAAVTAMSNEAGVLSVGGTTTNPWRQIGYSINVTPADAVDRVDASGLAQVGWRSVTPGFFRTLGIPLLRGRAFGPQDGPNDPAAVVISASLARHLWPEGDPVGRGMYWGEPSGRPRTVVGVVGDVRDVSISRPAPEVVYVPHAQLPMPDVTLLVATDRGPEVQVALRESLRRSLPGVAVPIVEPLSANRDLALAGPRLNSILLAAFALAAAALAAGGVYGVASFVVRQRRREIGLRMALGANSTAVRRLVSRQLASPATLGIAAGMVAARAASRLLESLLYSVSATEPDAYLASASLLAAVVFIATWLPAQRATGVDPQEALRVEGG